MQPITWDCGTGYDLFSSLYILHHPELFGLRPAWAAGVRSRLPALQRDFLQWAFTFFNVPLAWMYEIQAEPKNASAVLAALVKLAPDDRLPALCFSPEVSRDALPILLEVRARGNWKAAHIDNLRSIYSRFRIKEWPGMFQNLCDAWIQPGVFGERLLDALRLYCQVFFFEEEDRISPFLTTTLLTTQKLSEGVSPGQLVERLTKGLQLDLVASGVVLVPSFWAGPLVFVNMLSPDRYIVQFGGRGENQGLIPGEEVPQPLLEALKALADPTRLRLLRYLADTPLSLTELSRLVRLRPPTVLHHLYALRLAGLVKITFLENGERRYSLRRESLGGMQESLEHFLQSGTS